MKIGTARIHAIGFTQTMKLVKNCRTGRVSATIKILEGNGKREKVSQKLVIDWNSLRLLLANAEENLVQEND